ncbi:ATP-binding cassette domain-containing protein [Pseudonocardiaceae bacterium YIM PH 21723]|nr:ATP-binding cassette domain-containing protein [Pseudonocardiaceae bacterium YIM PH 21723]
MIEFRSVTKRFAGGSVAVDNLNLTVEDGSFTVFVGPSGCGKTTSLRMINRMLDPSEGKILIDGKDVHEGDPARLRLGIGYVIQHAGLFPHRTVLDNIATVPRLAGWTKAKARSRAGELLELVGLDASMAKRYPAQLSGGQQQRVGVARALAADPPILLMDEPFSAVDPVVREGLQDELLRLQSELDKTIVFVTHDIDEAIKLGEKVAVFRVGGVLAQYAEPAELLARPADDFVAGFVGRDRGYRALGFLPASQLPVGELATIIEGATIAQTRAVLHDGWAVVVDRNGKPIGWAEESRLHGQDPAATLSEDLLHAGGSLYQADGGNLRSALDAALSSPSGRGVAVDADGAVTGAVLADDVLAALARARNDGEVRS